MTKKVVRKGFSLGELPTPKDSSALCKSRFGFADVKALHDCRSSMKRPKKGQVTPERLMQFGFAYAPPLIIGAAVSNKVFDSLASGTKTVAQLSKETGAPARGLRAIMNALVGLELLKKDRHQKYSLMPESEAFLLSNKTGTLAGFFAMVSTHLLPDWLHLSEAVKTGAPPIALNQEATGPEFFSVLVENIIPMSYPAAVTLGQSLGLAKKRGPVRVLDIAAGSGIWGVALAQQSPRVHVTAQDWPAMIPITKRITRKFGVADRFSYVEGDVLQADFGNDYDVATLGHILHTEGEERSRKLLKKTFKALKSGGVIGIGEWLVNDQRTEPLPSLIFAVNMFIHSERGDTFSFNEIKSWLEEARFKRVRKLEAPGPSPLILATKP
jgi:ubiquinone/menaquinone biosynthesis C-methylase UbiE